MQSFKNSINDDIVKELLEQATLLINSNSTSSNYQVNIRRAMSSAYYALFHFLIIETVNLFCPKLDEKLKHQFCRSIPHKKIKEASIDFISECDKLKKNINYQKEKEKHIKQSNGKWNGEKKSSGNKQQGKYTEILIYPINQAITDMASIFPNMQDARHEADYGLSLDLSNNSMKRLQFLSNIQNIKDHIDNWRNLKNTKANKINKQVFLLMIFCHDLSSEKKQ